jgi:hypothetical protein
MAESRGGKEDMRLKRFFSGLCEQGTQYVGPEQFQRALTSRQLKVKVKANNIAGLQIADILAHPAGPRSSRKTVCGKRNSRLLQRRRLKCWD